MGAGQERREDSVAIPRTAFRFAITLAAAFIVAVSSILWTVVLDSVRHDDRLTALEQFGPKRGDRFTKADGEHLSAEIDKIDEWILTHVQWGRSIVGEWNAVLREHARRIDKLETNGE